MALAWRKRSREWRAVLEYERKEGRALPWRGMIHALLTGSVPRDIWRDRIRVCWKCPVYDAARKACRSPQPGHHNLGCGCYVPFTALTAEPYSSRDGVWVGCWGYAASEGKLGWPSYPAFSLYAKVRRFVAFLFSR